MSSIKLPGQLALSEGERAVWYGRSSYKAHAGAIIVGLLFLLLGLAFSPIVIISLIIWFFVFISVQTTEYFVSSRRVFIKRGLGGRSSHDLKVEWITGTIVHQGLLGRALNFGSIVFTGVGTAGNVGMSGVSDPLAVKGMVENLIQANKNRVEVDDKLKHLQEEYDLGRVDAAKYQEVKRNYEAERSKY